MTVTLSATLRANWRAPSASMRSAQSCSNVNCSDMIASGQFAEIAGSRKERHGSATDKGRGLKPQNTPAGQDFPECPALAFHSFQYFRKAADAAMTQPLIFDARA